MRPLMLLSLFVGITFIAASAAVSQEKRASGKVRGQLPQNWGKVGLSDGQKIKIYTIQTDYKKKIDQLKSEIEVLEATRGEEMFKVLTEDQRKKLLELVTGSKTPAVEVPEKKKEPAKP